MFKDMTPDQQKRAIRGINLKIQACLNAKRKLRERRDNAQISSSEELLIALELTRLQFKIDGLEDWKAAFKLNQRTLRAPSDDTIKNLQAQVKAIEALVAKDTAARTIVKAATQVAGSLPSTNLTSPS